MREAATRGWRRATKADAEAVEVFLRSRESRAAGLIARLLGEGRLRIPSLFGATGLWIRSEGEGPVEAATLGLVGGLWFVQLPAGAKSAAGLALALEEASRKPGFAPPKPTSVIGPASSVAAFEAALKLASYHAVDYRLMERAAWGIGAPAPDCEPRCPISLWKATPADLGELLPLQEAYEKEEVVTPLRGFDAESCRAFLARNLAVELIVAARLSGTALADGGPDRGAGSGEFFGRAVGKAATNARAFTLDQIGGVFVEVEYRGRGIAVALMAFLLGITAKEGRGSSLFVKKGNAPALSLYERLGFDLVDDFRASYQLPR